MYTREARNGYITVVVARLRRIVCWSLFCCRRALCSTTMAVQLGLCHPENCCCCAANDDDDDHHHGDACFVVVSF